MLKKRLLTLSMAFVMVTSIGFGTIGSDIAYAKSTKESSASTKDDTKDTLEKVVKIVKQRITIPSECTEFDYYLNSYLDNANYYSMTWSDHVNYRATVSVTADDKGNIISYRYYNYSDQTSNVSYLKSELENDAKAAVEKINPVMKGHIKLTSSSYSRYTNSYDYRFDRVENDISMDNYVEVSINADTKEVTGLNANWLFDADIPSADIKISKEEAKKLVKKQLKMELKYLTRYDYKDNEYKKSVFLAYVPSMNYISVDAKTGKIYTTLNVWNIIDSNTNYDAGAAESPKAESEVQLTDQEINALNILDQLITKEEAVKLITENKNLYLDSSAISISTYLSKYGEDYYWSVSFQDPREIDYSSDDRYRAYAYATIDAKSGIIKSYYSSINENKKPNTLKPIDGCQKKFEAFVNSQDKEMMSNAKFSKTEEDDPVVILDREEARLSMFTYYRMNEGVVYEDNSIRGGVDRGTGKVYMYNYSWDKDIKFESPKDVISAQKALDSYVALPGFDLKYEVNQIHTYDEAYEALEEYYYSNEAYRVEKEVRLVYNNTSIESGLISPFTGKEMDSDGKVLESKETVSYNYSDIKNHPYERSILLLSDIGLGYEKNKFSPDELITKEDFMKFFSVINYYYSSQNQDILTDYRVTRQQAAQYVIDYLGLTPIAQLDGIYTTGYTDEGAIKKDAIGAVALCKGFELLQFGTDNSFGPDEKLTRGEAAKLVMDMFSLYNKYH